MRKSGLPIKYAKLAHPRLHAALPRLRLFAQLDSLRKQHPIIWISSPPGAGKTTLAASYLAHAKVQSVWYQIDEGDADPASFFFFLAETVRNTKPALPWLAPELSSDIPRFARIFFRQYYARLPRNTVLVFDNIQEFDWESFGQLVEIALSEVPDGLTLLVLSRDAPPDRLARLELSGRIASVGWTELRLDDAEARSLAQLDDGAKADDLAWLERIDGWAAGIVMLREHVASHRRDVAMPQLEGQDTVFRYFAGEILERMPPASQRLLLMLSSLPGLTAAEAHQLTGDPAAARLLSRLFHSRLFMDRRGPAPHTYHFHVLFREFLQHEAEQRLDHGERTALLERAATILDGQGRTGEAARLYHEAAAYPQLASLLLRCAEQMLATGRGQSWREWAGWLPEKVMAAEPWLGYWQGSSLNHVDPVRGRRVLIQAAQVFGAAGDMRGRLLAIAAIIDSYTYEWADFRTLPEWINALQDGLASLDLATLDAKTSLKIHSRLTLALFLTDPGSPILAQTARRAVWAITQVDDPTEQLAAGTLLLDYFSTMDANAARQLFVSLKPLANNPVISPFYRIWWCRPASFQYQLEGNHRAAQEMILHGKQLADEFGLAHLQCHFNARLVIERFIAADLVAAGALLEEMRQSLLPTRKHDTVYLRMLETSYLAQTGDIQAALRTAREAELLSKEAAVGPRIRVQIYSGMACCYLQAGDFAAAIKCSGQAIENVYGMDKAYACNLHRFVRAYVSHRNGDDNQAAAILNELLSDLRRGEGPLSILFACFPHLSCVLFALALREGIELDYVQSLILRHNLPAPKRHTAHWPWPVAVRSFGKVELRLNGTILTSSGKAQQRPLMLLKALLVAGDGGKMQHALAAQLWPDADDQKGALNVTVHRLRKLLGHDRAVVVTGGKIRLHEATVWSDVSALEDVCAQAENLPDDAAVANVKNLAADLLNLYQGSFCDGDEDAWLLAPRERWRNHFLAAVGHLGRRLEGASEWQIAQHLYSRACEAEPLAEAIYRSLMRCAVAQGDPSAAMSMYRRCRETLSILLGRQPARETEKLAATLGLK